VWTRCLICSINAGFRYGIGNGEADEHARRHVKIARENVGSMPERVELPTLDMARLQRTRLAIALQHVDSRFLVDTDHRCSLRVLFVRCGMHLTDGCHLLGECLLPGCLLLYDRRSWEGCSNRHMGDCNLVSHHRYAGFPRSDADAVGTGPALKKRLI